MRLAVLLLLLIGALGAGGAVWLSRDAEGPHAVEAVVGATRVVFSSAYARDDAGAAGGYTDRLALIARFPDFAPLGPQDKAQAVRAPASRPAPLVFLTLSTKDDGVDPAERPLALYARFFEEEVADGPGGLILRQFERDSPYDLEQIYLAPPDGRAFFARCPKSAEARPGVTTPMCLTLLRVGDIDVELRYAPGLLSNWDALARGARALVSKFLLRPATAATSRKDR